MVFCREKKSFYVSKEYPKYHEIVERRVGGLIQEYQIFKGQVIFFV